MIRPSSGTIVIPEGWNRTSLGWRSFGSDEAVRLVGDFLLEKYVVICPKAGELLLSRKEEVVAVGRRLRMQYLGEPEIRGWHTEIMPRRRETEEQAALMMLMLMER